MTRYIATEQRIQLQDEPFLANVPLPHRATFFPLGFPVEIATNSLVVLEAAAQSWAMFRQRFDLPPLVFHLGVNNDLDDSSPLPPAPLCRIERHLLSNIADAHNFTCCNLDKGFAFGWAARQTVESTLYLRHYIIEAPVLAMVASLRAAPLHAACVSSNGYGMLLCGDSGAGKSSLAFAGARAGWTFTCDDACYLLLDRTDRKVVGNCYQFRLRDSGPQLFPELEGRAITPRATGKPSIEIPTQELPELITSESAIVHSIVFLNRSDVTKPELVTASRESVRSWFRQFSFKHTTLFAAQQAAIDRLLEVSIYELRYTDLDWAVDRLNTLAWTEH